MGILVPSFRDFAQRKEIKQVSSITQKRSLMVIDRLITLGELDFTGWPQVEEFAFMSKYITGIKFHEVGGIAPFQANGVWKSYEFYYRERNGEATLRLAPIGIFPNSNEAYWEAQISLKESSNDSWIINFLTIWSNLVSSQFTWVFQGFSYSIDSNNDLTVHDKETKKYIYYGKGNTRSEAYSNCDLSPLLVKKLEILENDGYLINGGERGSLRPLDSLLLTYPFDEIFTLEP